MTLAETPRDAGRGRVWEAAGAPRRSIPSFLPIYIYIFFFLKPAQTNSFWFMLRAHVQSVLWATM